VLRERGLFDERMTVKTARAWPYGYFDLKILH